MFWCPKTRWKMTSSFSYLLLLIIQDEAISKLQKVFGEPELEWLRMVI